MRILINAHPNPAKFALQLVGLELVLRRLEKGGVRVIVSLQHAADHAIFELLCIQGYLQPMVAEDLV